MTNLPSSSPASGFPFEAQLTADGQLHLSGVPEDRATIDRLVDALVRTQPFHAGWDAEYRTLYLLSGAATEPVVTLADVQAIPVPHWRRLRGELDGEQLRLTSREISDDGEHWRPYPQFDSAAEEASHPAFALPGQVVGRYFTLHWREGRIDIEPDPEGDLLEWLEHVVHTLNGEDDAAWQARHAALGGDPKRSPEAKRCTIEVRELAPLFAPSQPPLARFGALEYWPLLPLEFSRDGKKWEKYDLPGSEALEVQPVAPALPELPEGSPPELAALLEQFTGQRGELPDTDDGDDPFGLLSQLFDLQTAEAVVHADGRVDWDETEIPASQAEALRQSLLRSSGAGDPEQWAASTAPLVAEGSAAVPQAIRVQIMKQLLDHAPGMLEQAYAPTAVTFDGEHWTELAPLFMDEDNDSDGHG